MNALPALERNIVSVDWLHSNLGHPDLVVLAASMGNPAKTISSAIPGAILADIEGDFSEPDAPFPHTVPSNLTAVFEAAGISDSSTVVVYDRHGVMCAPRIWWLAKAAGLDKVAVLDGGLPAWIAAGGETKQISKPVAKGRITASPRELFTDLRGVERAAARSTYAVVDARSAGRFAGVEPEPRPGLAAGHIPGSFNLPFSTLFDDRGLLKAPTELRSMFESVVGSAEKLTFSCGSGVTACVDALAALEAGYEDVIVYDGSWSQWGSLELAQPIET